jgi:hypothetical protein
VGFNVKSNDTVSLLYSHLPPVAPAFSFLSTIPITLQIEALALSFSHAAKKNGLSFLTTTREEEAP